jgi:hypothetical protein
MCRSRRRLAALIVSLVCPAAGGAQTIPVGAGLVTMEVARLSPSPTTFTYGPDFSLFSYDAFAGTAPFALSATASLYDVNSLGCFPGDFVGFPAGAIALVDRGVCSFSEKSQNAQAVGAVGVLFVYDLADAPVTMIGDPDPLVPVFLLSQAVGGELRTQAKTGPVVVRLSYAYTPAVVPEPTTGALAAAGLLALAAAGSRRRARGR